MDDLFLVRHGLALPSGSLSPAGLEQASSLGVRIENILS